VSSVILRGSSCGTQDEHLKVTARDFLMRR
jgi:hypothetical protein